MDTGCQISQLPDHLALSGPWQKGPKRYADCTYSPLARKKNHDLCGLLALPKNHVVLWHCMLENHDLLRGLLALPKNNGFYVVLRSALPKNHDHCGPLTLPDKQQINICVTLALPKNQLRSICGSLTQLKNHYDAIYVAKEPRFTWSFGTAKKLRSLWFFGRSVSFLLSPYQKSTLIEVIECILYYFGKSIDLCSLESCDCFVGRDYILPHVT